MEWHKWVLALDHYFVFISVPVIFCPLPLQAMSKIKRRIVENIYFCVGIGWWIWAELTNGTQMPHKEIESFIHKLNIIHIITEFRVHNAMESYPAQFTIQLIIWTYSTIRGFVTKSQLFFKQITRKVTKNIFFLNSRKILLLLYAFQQLLWVFWIKGYYILPWAFIVLLCQKSCYQRYW